VDIADIEEFAGLNAAFAAYFSPGTGAPTLGTQLTLGRTPRLRRQAGPRGAGGAGPARTTVQAARVIFGAKVELSVVAKRPRDAPPLPPDGPLAAPGAAAEAVVEPGTRPVALLTYWDGQGNAEIIRLMMAVSVRLFRCLICWSPA
jgi:hypothetical protein